jgi:hypothetical protein
METSEVRVVFGIDAECRGLLGMGLDPYKNGGHHRVKVTHSWNRRH